MSLLAEIQKQFKTGSNLTRVVIINVGVFVVLHIIRILSWIAIGTGDSEFSYFLVANLQTYLNIDVLTTKPWTLFTYMFLQLGFWHLLSNMLILFWMGRIFVDMLNGKRFLAVYLLGGLSGALFAVLAYNFIPALAETIHAGSSVPMLGASAAVLAVTAAVGTYFPDYEIHLLLFGRVKLRYFSLGVVLLSVLFIADGNAGGQIAHIGGAVFGFIWAFQLKKGTDIAKWFMVIMDKIALLFKPRTKLKVTYKNTSRPSTKKSTPDATYVDFEEVTDNVKQPKELDSILDKIAKSGYESLSKKEKEKLFTASKNK